MLARPDDAEEHPSDALNAVPNAHGRPLQGSLVGDDPRDCDAARDPAVPRARDNGGGDQPETDRSQCARSEEPGAGERGEAEQQRSRAAPGHTGAGVPATASRTASAGVTPPERASGARIKRWERTGSATLCTSSGRT